MDSLIDMTDVTKVFTGGARTVALDDVTLHIAAGEFTAVMGASGSGKSTLLNLVAGLDRATSGRIVVDGIDLTRANESQLARYRRSHVGFVFQFFNLLSNLTVLENVMVPAELAGMRSGEARARAAELLKELGMADVHRPDRNRAAREPFGDHRVDHGLDAPGAFNPAFRRCIRAPERAPPGLPPRRKQGQPRPAASHRNSAGSDGRRSSPRDRARSSAARD